MPENPFDRSKHIYVNDAFSELVKDAIRFFNGTPVHSLPPPERFFGTGVYAIYYTGNIPMYKKYSELNRLSYNHPIYVGKAVPKGWRQSRASDTSGNNSTELFSRLREHANSINGDKNIKITDFRCRFMIFENEGSDMISTIEASLIKINTPLWNSALDGFGNHAPGKGRYEQAKSDWDVIHSGRPWANTLNGISNGKDLLLKKIISHLEKIKDK